MTRRRVRTPEQKLRARATAYFRLARKADIAGDHNAESRHMTKALALRDKADRMRNREAS